MPKNKFKQGDIVWADFSPSVGQEMKGKHPAVVVSSNSYNEKTNYLMVCPITSHGNHFPTYLDLFGYHIHGRVNAAQSQTFSRMRLLDEKPADHLRPEDMLKLMELLSFALQFD